MKKLMTIALAMMVSCGAFAQVATLKEAISLAGKDADKAAEMVKGAVNDASVTDKDRAAAYNALAQAYGDIYAKIATVELENQTLAKMGREAKPVDAEKMNSSIYECYKNLLECDKYDAQPDAKGKVKPKFRKANCTKYYNMRPNLVNAGLTYFNDKNFDMAKKAWSVYLDSKSSDLFAEKAAEPDQYLTQCAYFVVLAAYNTDDAETLNKYVELAKTDPEKAKDAMQLDVAMLDKQYKATKDVALLDLMAKKAQDAYDKTKDQMFFNTVMYTLQEKKDEAALLKHLDDFAAKNPESVLPNIYKGDMAMNAGKYQEAVDNYTKVAAKDDKNVALFYNIAVCYRNIASEFAETHAKKGQLMGANADKYKEYLSHAAENFEKVRALDPNQETGKFAYLLYSIYSGMGEKEKAAEVKAAYNIQD